MKLSSVVLIALTCLILVSCKNDDESKDVSLLTSKIWGQPTVMHRPGNLGYWSETTCPAGESIVFHKNGDYLRNNYCLDNVIDGKWSWIINDKELKLETYFNGIKQKTFILTIVELSDSILLTKEREENEPIESYFELKYKTRPYKR